MMNDADLKKIITCEKRIISAKRRGMLEENRSYRNDLTLESSDRKYTFKMFLRQSSEFIDDFSVGLIWTNTNQFLTTKKPVIMFRCQGPHDGKKPLDSDIHHSYHTHTICEDDLNSKRYLRPSNRETTDAFSTLDEAILYFCSRCGITGIEKFIDFRTNSEIDGQMAMF